MHAGIPETCPPGYSNGKYLDRPGADKNALHLPGMGQGFFNACQQTPAPPAQHPMLSKLFASSLPG